MLTAENRKKTITKTWTATLAGLSLLAISGLLLTGADGSHPPRYDAEGNLVQPQREAWREWVQVGTPLTPNSLNPPTAAFPEFHNVYMPPADVDHYRRTGEFREGTILIKELVTVGHEQALSGKGFFAGEFAGLEAAVKDTTRFPDEPGGWAYFTFSHEAPPYPRVAARQATASCNACHQAGTESGVAEDFVFLSYYPLLRAAHP